MPRFVLILMVRNEEKILRRCLEAVVGVVDAFCIHDTGSTDRTKEIATEFLADHPGSLTESVWSDFGTNRTNSFRAAKEFVLAQGWDPKETYGLLLDGDMVFQPGTLKERTLTDVGYTIIQVAGSLEYPNCRLVRMDHDWVCRGVTHEYWDGPTTALPRSLCWIDDRNDGGCKSDKFERDARLLEQGLKEDPTNVRYMFYLAQTYHSLGRYKDSIAMYTKRYDAGGWDEERWFSLYMIGQCYQALKDPVEFEAWMLRAHAFRPSRAEPLYKLTRHFRETSQHYKAYQYLTQGQSIPKPNDSLFVESDVYNGLFAYEKTILDYYIGRHTEGLAGSMSYLMKHTTFLENVYQNMGFYIKPLGLPVRSHPIDRTLAGSDYHPTSVSTTTYKGRTLQNVRFVNYVIDQRNGSYTMKEGTYSSSHHVRTRNVFWDGEMAVLMDDASIGIPRRDAHIRGLEDLRLYSDDTGTLRFLATSWEYSEKIRQIAGTYDIQAARLRDCRVIESPTHAECEKNWIPIPETKSIVYRWSPLEIGHLEETKLVIDTRHTTPWLFQHLRGSAAPVRLGPDLLFLVHFVEYTQPRKYYHCFVALDATTYKPLRMSLPFVFAATGIEYCIGVTRVGLAFECIFSSWDDNPRIVTIPLSSIEWLHVEMPPGLVGGR
jgi:glycosyltransferase involved in cell wall biosynthesis